MRISDWSSDVCSSDLLLRSEEDAIDVSNYTIDGDNNLIAADLDNVYVRTERYSRQSKTEFYQISGRLEQRLTDTLAVNLLGGLSKSQADIPVETTLAFDDVDATGDRKSPPLNSSHYCPSRMTHSA